MYAISFIDFIFHQAADVLRSPLVTEGPYSDMVKAILDDKVLSNSMDFTCQLYIFFY